MADRLDLGALREHIDDGYDANEVARALAGLEQRLHRRKVARYTVSAAAALTLAFVAWRFQATPVASSTLVTEDGSVATALSSDTELRVQSEAAEQVELALTRGRGHFEVTRNPRRRYRVRAGEVTVEVLGTAFEVTRRAHDTQVRVEHGLVKVSWAHGERLLHAGEQGVFPPVAVPVPAAAPLADATLAPPPVEPARTKSHEAKSREAKSHDESWRALARAGKHREAFGAMGQRPVQDLDGLLLAADAARLSGHPREAAQHLERLVHDYPESAPARLAAFTLGRLQLHELADPLHAARSFARAYALDPHGPLAEDALAREAEAYRRAGNRQRAAEVAARYLEQFPSGGRRAEMSAYVAL